eukprot:scaffold28851_cov56-Attheya_sp.AAC.2
MRAQPQDKSITGIVMYSPKVHSNSWTATVIKPKKRPRMQRGTGELSQIVKKRTKITEDMVIRVQGLSDQLVGSMDHSLFNLPSNYFTSHCIM